MLVLLLLSCADAAGWGAAEPAELAAVSVDGEEAAQEAAGSGLSWSRPHFSRGWRLPGPGEAADRGLARELEPQGERWPPPIDLDGDGVEDLVVGSPSAGDEAGAVHVSFGGTGDVEDWRKSSIYGAAAGDRIGTWLATGDDATGGTDLYVGGSDSFWIYANGFELARHPTVGPAFGAIGAAGPITALAEDGALVILNRGDFEGPRLATHELPAPAATLPMLVADADGDGHTDILFVSGESLWELEGPLDVGSEAVLLAGEEALATTTALALVDLDDDGAADVVALAGGGLVVVHDVLGAPTITQLGSGDTDDGRLVVGPLLGDDTMFAFAALRGDDDVEVVDLASGTIVDTLAAPSTDPVDYGDSLDLLDVDQDGFPEVLIARPTHPGGGAIEVWRGTTQLATLSNPDTSLTLTAPSFALVDDLDGDGLPDLAGTHGAQALLWSGAIGNGAIGSLVGLRDDRVGSRVAMVGDVDGSGSSHLLVGDPDEGYLLLYRLPVAIGDSPWWTGTTGGGQLLAGGADIDGDGYDDFATWEESSSSMHRLELFRGAGGGSSRTIHRQINLTNPASVAGADLDGDGYGDFAVGGDDGVWVWNGSATGLSRATENVYAGVGGYSAVIPGDFDRDGTDDLIVGSAATSGYSTLSVLNVPGTEATSTFTVSGPGGTTPVIAAVGDLNGDGAPDLVVGPSTCPTGSRIFVVYGGDRPSAAVVLPLPADAIAGCSPMALGDLDGDGLPEFAMLALDDTRQLGHRAWVLSLPNPDDLASLRFTPLYALGGMGAEFGRSVR